MTRLYLNQQLHSKQTIEVTDAGRVHYLKNVMRLRKDDSLTAFYQRQEFAATIKSISKTEVILELGEQISCDTESPLQIHLGQCLSRGERMDYSVQKAVELGASSITPLFSRFSQVKLNSSQQQKKLAHWQAIAISAAEQSGRTTVPNIHPPAQLPDWVQQIKADFKLALHEKAREPLQQPTEKPHSLALLIGPEGGLEQGELSKASEHGFTLAQFGPRVLRTESVAPAILAITQYLWGDMGYHG